MKNNFIKIFLLLYTILFLNIYPSYSAAIQDTSLQQIQDTYGKIDLGSKPAFQGGYINFGYWKAIQNVNNNKILTPEDRINSSKHLYEKIVKIVNPKKNETILEVGCGRGNGCVQLMETYRPQKLFCIDVTPEQISRAKHIHSKAIQNYPDLSFAVGSAYSFAYPNATIDKIYSVEVAQYFEHMDKFAHEAWRLLKPGGKLVLTAHFATSKEGHEETKKLLPTVKQGVDRMLPISEVEKAFIDNGFKLIKLKKIGNHVFYGHDKWSRQVSDAPWVKDILHLYKSGYIDYYILYLEKPLNP
jgi:cyclopropane fatty-acyl-phospholipid synthase-like methyltransferase